MSQTAVRTRRLRARGYNELKRRALAVFAGRAWLNVPAWSVLAQVYPTRAAYSYLWRLHRWGLLERRRDARGLVLYRLSARGAARLSWLRVRMG
jgi:hypothetical protein